MKWITREKVKVDRVACPWLIQHFVDPRAEFLFLPQDTDWSKIDKGIVFDVPNCELGLSDHKILEREFVVYDALYQECKREMTNATKSSGAASLFEIASIVR